MPSRRVLSRALLLAIPLATMGCGKELGRVTFAGEGTASTTVTLAAGDVDLWTALDIEYEGDAALAYTVELVQGGATVATTVCNPLARLTVRTGWTSKSWGGSHSSKGNGKMACSVHIPSGGPTTVNATLAFSRRPTKLRLTQADLLVKQ